RKPAIRIQVLAIYFASSRIAAAINRWKCRGAAGLPQPEYRFSSPRMYTIGQRKDFSRRLMKVLNPCAACPSDTRHTKQNVAKSCQGTPCSHSAYSDSLSRLGYM